MEILFYVLVSFVVGALFSAVIFNSRLKNEIAKANSNYSEKRDEAQREARKMMREKQLIDEVCCTFLQEDHLENLEKRRAELLTKVEEKKEKNLDDAVEAKMVYFLRETIRAKKEGTQKKNNNFRAQSKDEIEVSY